MVLTQERAEARSEVIKKNSVEYDFHVALESGDNYSGYSELLFELITVPKELTIDFKGNEVARLLLNG